MPAPAVAEAGLRRGLPTWVLLSITALALLLRVAFVYWNAGEGGLYSRSGGWALDAADYDRLAQGLLAGEGYTNCGEPTAWRPPAYPLFLAAVYALFGPSYTVVRLLQAAMGAAVVALLTGWGGRVFGARAGVLSGLAAAFYPWLIFWSSELLTESLYGLLAMSAVLAWWRMSEDEPVPAWLGPVAGLAGGAACLTRPVFLPALAGLAALTLLYRHRRWREVLAGLLCAAAVIAPWTVRNRAVLGEAVLISTNGGYNFYLGTFSREQLVAEFGLDYGEAIEECQPVALGEVQADREFNAAVRQHAAAQPLSYLTGRFRQFLHFWVVPGFAEFSSRSEQLLKFWVFLPVLLGGLAGLLLLGWRRRCREFLLCSGVFLAASFPYALSFGGYRFRIPVVDPLLLLLAGYFLAELSTCLKERGRRGS